MTHSKALLVVSGAAALIVAPLIVGLLVLMYNLDVHPFLAALITVALVLIVAKLTVRRISLYAEKLMKSQG